MNITDRDKRALLILGICVLLVLLFRVMTSDNGPTVVSATVESIPLAEKRLARLRQMAAAVPAREEILKTVNAELVEREAGLIQADTASQAQARLIQIVRAVGREQSPPVDLRNVEIGSVRSLGQDYGEILVSVSVDCHIEQLVNLLSDLTKQKELIATSEIRVGTAHQKEKTMPVRLTISGVVARKLVPDKKGVTPF